MAREKESRAESQEQGKGVIEQALEAHGLRADQCIGTAERNGEAILATWGGQKIRWKPGQPPVPIRPGQHPDAKPMVKARKK